MMANLSDDDDDFGELIYRSSHTAKLLKTEEDEQKKKPDKNTSSFADDDVSTDREGADAKSYQPDNVKSIDEGEDTDNDGEAILEQKMPSSSPASVSQTQKMMAMLPENPPTLPPLPPTLPPLPPIANNTDEDTPPKPLVSQESEI